MAKTVKHQVYFPKKKQKMSEVLDLEAGEANEFDEFLSFYRIKDMYDGMDAKERLQTMALFKQEKGGGQDKHIECTLRAGSSVVILLVLVCVCVVPGVRALTLAALGIVEQQISLDLFLSYALVPVIIMTITIILDAVPKSFIASVHVGDAECSLYLWLGRVGFVMFLCVLVGMLSSLPSLVCLLSAVGLGSYWGLRALLLTKSARAALCPFVMRCMGKQIKKTD